MTDMNTNLEMLGTSGVGGVGMGQAAGGVAAAGAGEVGLLDQLTQNPELLAIVLDMIGSKVDPENPFAGVGTTLGKSRLLAKEDAENRAKAEKFQTMIGNLVQSITGGKQDGISNLSISRDDDGAYKYKLDGLEQGKDRRIGTLDTTGSEKTIKTSEEFMKTFGEGGL